MRAQVKKMLDKLKKVKLSAEDKYFFRKYGSVISRLRRDPTFQARILHGIVVPPHERAILRHTRFPQYSEYHLIGGRGTAKSFTFCSVAATLYAEAFGSRKITSLSASKFRGGKVIMEEALSFILGRLDSQRPLGPYAPNLLTYGRGLKREGDRWYIPFSTHSVFYTVPTGNLESVRGLRSNSLFLDEADNWEKDEVDKILEPFLAVGSKFDAPGTITARNKLFWTGTVSHTHKDWAKTFTDRELIIKKRYQAEKHLLQGDYKNYESIMSENNERVRYASTSLQRWDYTDLIIPLTLKQHDVYYPVFDRFTNSAEINSEDFVKYDRRDKVSYIYTYPVEKHIPDKQLDDGLTDFDTWAAEWRCQLIETSGNVYPFALIEKVTKSELIKPDDLKKKGWSLEERGVYYPPVLYECSDPCVLAIDPARTSDFTAFVVIRLGELATGEYDPLTGTGSTAWNNIIWAEQRKNMTIKQVVQKIHQFKSRYNLHVSENPIKAPAITIDARGAMSGTTIQDELARPSPPVDPDGIPDPTWTPPNPIYDPTDKAYTELSGSSKAWPGLRLLWTTDQMNTDLVSFSKGQMEVSKLYIGAYKSSRERFEVGQDMSPGYIGVQVLAHQLMSIQAKPTANAFKYYTPGDSNRVEMKKDLFSAFLYANFALRQHLSLLVKGQRKEPVMAALQVRPGGTRRRMFNNSLYR